MSELRIFSYLPNPRIWKATITARLCGVELELRGTSSKDIAQWLWDFDARPLTEAPEKVSASERIGRIAFEGRRLYKPTLSSALTRSVRYLQRSAPMDRWASSSRTASCELSRG